MYILQIFELNNIMGADSYVGMAISQPFITKQRPVLSSLSATCDFIKLSQISLQTSSLQRKQLSSVHSFLVVKINCRQIG